MHFLSELGKSKGFKVNVVPPQQFGPDIMSSSRIRESIAEGDLDTATRFLGRYPSVRGRVIRGDQRGRQLGFPTANLAIADRRLIPANGIYAVKVKIGDHWRAGAASIGIRPTFGGGQRLVEVYVLDFDGDLYDQVIEVQFVKRLREERKFESVQALIAQMQQDVVQSRQLLSGM